jgi:hypothetical protein
VPALGAPHTTGYSAPESRVAARSRRSAQGQLTRRYVARARRVAALRFRQKPASRSSTRPGATRAASECLWQVS